MIIGIPKEIKAQENRVGLLPSAVYQLVKRSHSVLVGKDAGAGAGAIEIGVGAGSTCLKISLCCSSVLALGVPS